MGEGGWGGGGVGGWCIIFVMAVFPNIPGLDGRAAAALAEFCARHRVKTLRIFGSFARGEAEPDSDLDVLIEFQEGVDPDLFQLGGMQQDLSDLAGREVDLKTPAMFTPAGLSRILAGAVIGYAA